MTFLSSDKCKIFKKITCCTHFWHESKEMGGGGETAP